MKAIGITGGIGSGKTTICRIIEKLNYPVFYADQAAKDCMHEDEQLKSEIISRFGSQSYVNNVLNRPFLADEIFNNSAAKEALNALVHPAVYRAFEKWKTVHRDKKIVFNESALLFETGSYTRFDATVLVVSDLDMRIDRVMERDKITKEQVLARIAHQLKDDEKIKLAQFVIHNNHTQLIIPQLLTILEQLQQEN